MGKVNVEELINYWKKNSERDYETMLGLFRIRRYPESLFYGHIILEKILKGLVVQGTKKHAPYIHDLVRLQQLAKVELQTEQVSLLKEVNNFNIKGRYPDYKLRFFKLCTKSFAKIYLDKIIKLYKELCQKLMLKK